MDYTRADVLKDYDVDQAGRIRSPGKFEGQMLYVPVIHSIILNGFGEGPNEDYVTVDAELKREFPELNRRRSVRLWFSDSGFVGEA